MFVERAPAILDGFELTDADAPIVSDICRKLGGVALAIELAAARTDAFGIQQLAVLLDDRFRILKQGKRTAQPRHRSLTATLDWSYEFLPESERLVLCRLSVFAGAFTLTSAIAVAEDDTDVVDALANLVAKSLVSADVGGATVLYRLLDTTRAYATQKLADTGDLGKYSRRHARHHLDWFKRAEADWRAQTKGEWIIVYGRKLDDVRVALNWAFAPGGDASIGIELTEASIPLWFELSLLHECRERLERALAGLAAQADPNERIELHLRVWHAHTLTYVVRRLQEIGDHHWSPTLALAEKLGDSATQARILHHWTVYCLYIGDYRRALALAEKICVIAADSDEDWLQMMGQGIAAEALYFLGSHSEAARRILPLLRKSALPRLHFLTAYRIAGNSAASTILWVLGLPDQAFARAKAAVGEASGTENRLPLSGALIKPCQVALHVGDFTTASSWVEMLLDCTAKMALGS